MRAIATPESDVSAQLLRDAFAVLDRHSTEIANRDPSRSLNEDRCELLCRVRAALDPLLFNGAIRRDDVTEILRRIDEFITNECAPPRVVRAFAAAVPRAPAR
jgi:hypothetical protein